MTFPASTPMMRAEEACMSWAQTALLRRRTRPQGQVDPQAGRRELGHLTCRQYLGFSCFVSGGVLRCRWLDDSPVRVDGRQVDWEGLLPVIPQMRRSQACSASSYRWTDSKCSNIDNGIGLSRRRSSRTGITVPPDSTVCEMKALTSSRCQGPSAEPMRTAIGT